jgi:hypothetical protein
LLLFQYENLRSQATAMKDKYEDRINDLLTEMLDKIKESNIYYLILSILNKELN